MILSALTTELVLTTSVETHAVGHMGPAERMLYAQPAATVLSACVLLVGLEMHMSSASNVSLD